MQELSKGTYYLFLEGDSRVRGGGRRVIREAEPVPVIASPLVEKALVTAVPTTFRLR